MATLDSPFNTYSDTTPQKRVITDYISLLDPSDAPAIMALGGLDGASSKFRFINENGKVCEWLEDTLSPLADALNGSITSVATTITVDDAGVLQEGHIILIDSEQLWVSSVGASEVVTVTRAFGGTAATHADNAVVTIIGMARLEGDESDDIAFTDRTSNSNFTSILHKEIKVTRTQNQIAQYGIAEEFTYQQNKVVPELMRLLERHFYYSTASGSGNISSAPRVMGGYQTFITNNKVSGATLAQSQFETAIQSAFEDGGTGPWLALCAPANLVKIKNFYDSSSFLRVDRGETTVGMEITSIHTPFGNVDLVLDRWAKTTEIPLIDVKHAGFKTFYPFTFEPLAKSGDYQRGEVVGEFTLCIRQDKAHALLTAVS